MSAQNEHNDLNFSPRWDDALRAARNQDDLLVPENYFADAESSMLMLSKKSPEEEFDVPEGYFAFSEEKIIADLDPSASDEAFFSKQQEQILKRMKLETIGRNDLDVPAGYFEKGREAILQKTTPAVRVISMRSRFFWYAGAAAAIIAGVVFFILPDKNQAVNTSFAELAGKTELDIEDVEYFASEDELYDLFYVYEEIEVADTLVQDSTAQKMTGPETLDDLPAPAGGAVQLDPRTGLPMKKSNGNVKPTDAADVPSWNDISNEELLEYLLEEGDEDLINDL